MPGSVTMATTGVSVSPWKNANTAIVPFDLRVDITVSGTSTFQLEYTQSEVANPGVTPVVYVSTVKGTGTGTFSVTDPVRYWRLNQTAGTGTTTVEVMQAGITNR